MTRPQHFRLCYRSGRLRKNRLAVLHVADAPDGVTRVGYSVSKKIGNAVARNRVKRLLRESMRAYADNIVPGVHLVVSARVVAREASFQELRAAVGDLLRRAGMLQPSHSHSTKGAN